MLTRKGDRGTLFLVLYALVLLTVAATTPISPSEAYLFYQDQMTPTTVLMHWGDALLPNELGLRLFFLLLGALNAYLFYLISSIVFQKREDRFLTLFFYLMLPGVIISTVLANDAVLVTALVLLFLYAYLHKKQTLSFLPLLLLSLVHWSALYFYMILMLYGLFQKEKQIFLAAVSAVLFYLLLGIERPEPVPGNHFFEMLGIYATIFSPLLFVYLFYALYRTLLRGSRDLLWYISFGALVISLILSLQERVKVTDFSAYLMLGIIVAVRTYLESLNVRLRRFQKSYRLFFGIVMIPLFVSVFTMILHQPIYRILGKRYYPVVAPVYVPYDNALALKKRGKKCTETSTRKVLYQMRYYGLEKCF